MQTQNANVREVQFVFRNVVRSMFQRVLPVFQAARLPATPSIANVSPSTPVANLCCSTLPSVHRGTKRGDFFKRTYQEIEAGLTIEQARAARGVSATPKTEKSVKVVETKSVQAPKVGTGKAKRFRR